MSLINIPLIKGENWISFPEGSSDNLDTIFKRSGISSSNTTVYLYNSITSGFVQTNLTSNIKEGKGYHILTTSPGTIVYNGIPYETKMSFEKVKSSLMNGYNLVGTDDNTIDISNYNWCKIIDAQTNFAVKELLPMKAYWIFYPDDCKQPFLGLDMLTKVSIIGVLITGYVVFGEDIKNFLRGRQRTEVGKSVDRRKKLLMV